ncbi:MAG: SAM-dependent chlorinase/fluorinase [Candidatus Competibacteraceae bacterium]
MLALFTDFGLQGPYVGLLKLALLRYAPSVPIIDLLHDAPAFAVQEAAYLLAAYVPEFPAGTVFVGIVDPGVGGTRAGLLVRVDENWLVGPDNGLFDRVVARARQTIVWRITWQPKRLSASFHGRDLFAPVAAQLATGTAGPEQFGELIPFSCRDWPEELARIVYIDRYGNAMTGIRAAALETDAMIQVGDWELRQGQTFSTVPVGQGLWYENSSGLVELAVNQGSAAEKWGLRVGDAVKVGGETRTVIHDH